jgi:hypothetical protein
MRDGHRWLVGGLVIAALQLSACQQHPGTSSKEKPAKLERIQGTELNRVILTKRAAERLDIKTAPVQTVHVARKGIFGGQVVASKAAQVPDRSRLRVRVPLSRGEYQRVARGYPALVHPLVRGDGGRGLPAQPLADDDEDDDDDGDDEDDKEKGEKDDKPRVGGRQDAGSPRLYYVVDKAAQHLIPGQRVRVELLLSGSGTLRNVVPYAAVLYDPRGDTWVYTNPEPLVFVRHLISVEYIEGDLAVLSSGPSVGTAVVTVGAAELFGIEFGIGK